MTSRRSIQITVGLALGVTIWALSTSITGQREPFDGNLTYYILAMFGAGVLAALVSPRTWWLGVIGIFLGQHLYAFVAYPDTRAWLLFGLVVNALMPTWLPAAAGGIVVLLISRSRKQRPTEP